MGPGVWFPYSPVIRWVGAKGIDPTADVLLFRRGSTIAGHRHLLLDDVPLARITEVLRQRQNAFTRLVAAGLKSSTGVSYVLRKGEGQRMCKESPEGCSQPVIPQIFANYRNTGWTWRQVLATAPPDTAGLVDMFHGAGQDLVLSSITRSEVVGCVGAAEITVSQDVHARDPPGVPG